MIQVHPVVAARIAETLRRLADQEGTDEVDRAAWRSDALALDTSAATLVDLVADALLVAFEKGSWIHTDASGSVDQETLRKVRTFAEVATREVWGNVHQLSTNQELGDVPVVSLLDLSTLFSEVNKP